MGKVEIGIYFCVSTDILTFKFKKKKKKKKKNSKIFFLRSHKGGEAETLHKCSWH